MQAANETPEPAANSYVIVPASGGPFYESSAKEGFICSAIWAASASILAIGLMFWAEQAHPEKLLMANWAGFVGGMLGQFLVMSVCLSVLLFFRRRKNITNFILLDWRWWLAGVTLFMLQEKNALPWLWVGLIYQARLSMKPLIPHSASKS